MLIVNEWRFFLRQPQVLLSLILVPLFAFMLSGGVVEGGYSPEIQLQLSQVTLLMLLLPIVQGILSPSIFLRDTTSNMTELINCTPISYAKRWLLRYGTLVGLFVVLYVLSFSFVMLSYALEFGFQIEFLTLTLLNLTILVLPSILFMTAFALWLSTFWQSAMIMYASIAAFGMSYLMLGSMTGSPILAGSSMVSESFYNIMLWLDPYGITALIDNLKPDNLKLDHNNAANAYASVELLINRLIYLLLSVAFVYLVIKKAPVLKANDKHRKGVEDTKKDQQNNTSKNRVSRVYTSPFIQLIKVPFFTLLHNRVTQVIFFIWPLLIFNEVMSGILYAGLSSESTTNSIDALNLVAFDLLSVLGSFVVALWSWFICSRDKSFNIAELIAATPISNLQLICAQIIALGLLISILILLTFVGSSVAELLAGSDWLFGHYLVQLSLSALPLLLLGTLFISIYHLCRSTAIAGAVVLTMILIKFSSIMTSLGLTHTLWNFADSPLQAPDNFWGYSASGSVYLPYMAFWVITCISFILLAANRSHRGTGLGNLSIKGLPISVLLSLFVTALAGLSLHLALVGEKPLTNSDKRDAWQAQYEKTFGDWQHTAQPVIAHIDAEVDIYPTQELANIKLSYTLENRTTTPIKQVLIGRYGNYNFADISFNSATLVEFDAELNQGIYQFEKQLMPGEKRLMHAEFSFKQSQYWPHRSHQVVKADFAYIRANPLLPTVGYQVDHQLESPDIRAKYKLKKIENIAPSLRFKENTHQAGAYQWASLSTVVSTKEGHHAISQGELVSSWKEDQRAFFKFQTKQPIHAIPTWLSVPYAALSQKSQGTTLNVYSPQNNEASQIHLKAMADTVTWFSDNIAAYTGAQLNLFAVPDIGSGGYDLPQIILINHSIGFRAKPSTTAGFDQRYCRVVDETAQQWFGHNLGNNVPEERSFISKSLPKYIELVITEKHYGENAMLALIEKEQKQYKLKQRNNMQTPVALVDARQTHDIHSRATLAFAKLRATVGDQVIIAAIKLLWLQHAHPKTPATSMDFVQALKTQSAANHHPLINELFLSKAKFAFEQL